MQSSIQYIFHESSIKRDIVALTLSIFINGLFLFAFFYSNIFHKNATTSAEVFEVTLLTPPLEQTVLESVTQQELNRELPKPQVVQPNAEQLSVKTTFVVKKKTTRSTKIDEKSVTNQNTASQPQEFAQNTDFSVPSIEAEPIEQIKPRIPDELRSKEFKSFVRVKVEVNIDGASQPTLKTSSGNEQIDAEVINALKKWTWKPGFLEGKPVRSVRYFKFEFEVE